MNHPRRFTLLTLLTLTVLLALVTGCSRDSNPLAPGLEDTEASEGILPVAQTFEASDDGLESGEFNIIEDFGDPSLDGKNQTVGWVAEWWGGTVTLDYFSIVAPPRAVDGFERLTIRKPEPGTAIVDLGPHGMTFDKPVTLRFDLAFFEDYLQENDIDIEKLSVLHFDEQLDEWIQLESSIVYRNGQPQAVTAQTNHFSRYALSD